MEAMETENRWLICMGIRIDSFLRARLIHIGRRILERRKDPCVNGRAILRARQLVLLHNCEWDLVLDTQVRADQKSAYHHGAEGRYRISLPVSSFTLCRLVAPTKRAQCADDNA